MLLHAGHAASSTAWHSSLGGTQSRHMPLANMPPSACLPLMWIPAGMAAGRTSGNPPWKDVHGRYGQAMQGCLWGEGGIPPPSKTRCKLEAPPKDPVKQMIAALHGAGFGRTTGGGNARERKA